LAKAKPDTNEIWATGRRKTAVARVRMRPGTGNITVNGMSMAEYFERKLLELKIMQPLELTKTTGMFDFFVNASGGGKAGQAGALRHGVARALIEFDAKYRPSLKREGMLTRDPREKERKKYGRKRARKGFQWTKR